MSAPGRRYLQLDVFAARPGCGNPLGVILDSDGLDSDAMQALAAWLGLPETVFFVPAAEGADYHVRIFTPDCELPFAGHPSVGAAWAAVARGLASPRDGRLTQQCAAGLLPAQVRQVDSVLHARIRAPRAQALPTAPHAQALLDAAHRGWALAAAPALWNNGPGWWLLELADAQSVRRARPDFGAIAALARATASLGVALFAAEAADGHDLVVRAFCPADAPNTPEDPVTGSANACIAAWLHAQGRLPGIGGACVASQGREVGRDGRVHLQVDADGEIWIGGQVQGVVEGTLHW